MCKELNTYNRIAGYLNKIFDRLNEHFFDSELERPTITIQSTPRAFGHFSIDKVWSDNKEHFTHEINIGAGTLNRPIEEVIATLQHECIHYYCSVHGIKDCSGYYHNKNFKDEAEKRGLHIEKHDTYGWTITTPNDELLQFIIDNDFSDILLNRTERAFFTTTTGTGNGVTTTTPTATPKRNNNFTYKCPKCGMSLTGHKAGLKILCMECNEQLEER